MMTRQVPNKSLDLSAAGLSLNLLRAAKIEWTRRARSGQPLSSHVETRISYDGSIQLV